LPSSAPDSIRSIRARTPSWHSKLRAMGWSSANTRWAASPARHFSATASSPACRKAPWSWKPPCSLAR
jgi:hypothetical protein